jgi:N-acetyl-alpha-D-muramate 1-phosphate uridylyltransferase
MTAFPVAILAGGLASRLHPITARTPKSLLAIAGRPFILHQLDLLRSQGVERVVLCVGHLGEQIQAVVGDGGSFGLSVAYSFDGTELLGTGGAIKQALPLLGKQFMVLYGDSYLPCSLAEVQSAYLATGYPALMTVLHNDGRWERSNVLMRDGKLVDYNKASPLAEMAHVDFGLTVLSSEVFARYAGSRVLDLADMCHELARAGELAALEMRQRFYEIGSLRGIAETEQFLLGRAGSA